MPDDTPPIRSLDDLRKMAQAEDLPPEMRQSIDQLIASIKSYLAEWNVDPHDEHDLNAVAAGIGFTVAMEQTRAEARSPEDDVLDMIAGTLGIKVPPRNFVDVFETAGAMALWILAQSLPAQELPDVDS